MADELPSLITDFVRRVMVEQAKREDAILRECILSHGLDHPWERFIVEILPGHPRAYLWSADQPIPNPLGFPAWERRLFQITPEAVQQAFADAIGEDRICAFPIKGQRMITVHGCGHRQIGPPTTHCHQCQENPVAHLGPTDRYPLYTATLVTHRGDGIHNPEQQVITTHDKAVWGAFLRAVADTEDPYVPDFPPPVPVWTTFSAVNCERCHRPALSLMDKLRDVHRVQGDHGNWNFSPYMRGLFNGLELALSILEGERKPRYREEPDGYLCDIPPFDALPTPEQSQNVWTAVPKDRICVCPIPSTQNNGDCAMCGLHVYCRCPIGNVADLSQPCPSCSYEYPLQPVGVAEPAVISVATETSLCKCEPPLLGTVINNQMMCARCGRNTGLTTPDGCEACSPEFFAAYRESNGSAQAAFHWMKHLTKAHPEIAVKFATMQPEGLNPPLT